MTFGSLFAGIGGFDCGFERSGMRCAWQVEIDKSSQKVLQRHWHNVERFSDVKECGKHNLARVDVLCGGFPCQDLSVAGRRQGLAGERSGLWFEFARIIGELEPRFVVIENVPGLLSSNSGRDIQTILDDINNLGYVASADILDAQFFGVAQRRRRIFLICERLEVGLQKKSDFCAIALCIAIIESSLISLKEHTDPSKEWREGLISRVSQDGVEKKMKFFDCLRGQKLWGRLPSVLADAMQKSAHDCENLGCLSELKLNGYTSAAGIVKKFIRDIGCFAGRMRAESEETILSMSKLWKEVWEEKSKSLNLSTTSMEFQRIIEYQICMSAKIVLLICKHIVAWKICCPFWWPAASLALTALKEFIEYARRASEELFIEPDIRREYWDFGIQAEKFVQAFRSLGTGSAAKILFERADVSWDPPTRRKAGKGIASTFKISVGIGGDGTVNTLNSGGNNGGFRTEPGEHIVAMPLLGKGNLSHDESLETYVAFDERNITSWANRSNPQPGDPSHTLHADPPRLAFMRNVNESLHEGEKSGNAPGIIISKKSERRRGVVGVRRLTPL